ncbi:MAG: hypothetical protein V4685_10365, partial [Bacteroidota bacterium]
LVFHSQFDQLQLRTGITDMIFPENNNIGYAADADRILKTTDKGLTWTPVYTLAASYFTDLEAVDNNTVFALNTAYSGNSLNKTLNGGSTWTWMGTGFVPTGKMSYVYFLNANTGWMSVYDNTNKLYFYKTINGGTNWTLQNNVNATPFNSYKFRFIDENTGYALSGQNQVFKTFNSGITWEPLARNNQYTYLGYTHNDLQCFSINQVWAGGGHGFLELNTNANNSSIPKGYFSVDTSGAGPSVTLTNFSRTGYSYQWFVNGVSIGTSYNA